MVLFYFDTIKNYDRMRVQTNKRNTTHGVAPRKKAKIMIYIQRKDTNGLETVDQFDTRKEAKQTCKEYQLSDASAEYYISTRACKDWMNTHQTNK